jgi:hypothetical protein
MQVDDYAEADRRVVEPPIEVESAAWSTAGTLDWWVKERQQWLGRVRGPDGRQRWVKATDLRPRQGLRLAVRCRCQSLLGPHSRPDETD